MITIHKYILGNLSACVDGPLECVVDIPRDSKILCVNSQRNDICIWAMINTDSEMLSRTFNIFGTGWPMSGRSITYIGTCQTHEGKFVWHVFEEKQP